MTERGSSSGTVTNLRPGQFPFNWRGGVTLALGVLLLILAYGSCRTRGTELGPVHTDYLIMVGLSIVITLLCAWLVRSSIIGVIPFLLCGSFLTVAPELYWRPKDLAFQERVRAIEKVGNSAGVLIEGRPWPCSDYDLVYEDGEIYVVD